MIGKWIVGGQWCNTVSVQDVRALLSQSEMYFHNDSHGYAM